MLAPIDVAIEIDTSRLPHVVSTISDPLGETTIFYGTMIDPATTFIVHTE